MRYGLSHTSQLHKELLQHALAVNLSYVWIPGRIYLSDLYICVHNYQFPTIIRFSQAIGLDKQVDTIVPDGLCVFLSQIVERTLRRVSALSIRLSIRCCVGILSPSS